MKLGMYTWTRGKEIKINCLWSEPCWQTTRTHFGAQHPPPAAAAGSWHIQYVDLKYLVLPDKIELNSVEAVDLHLMCSIWVYFVTCFDAFRAVRRTVQCTVLT